MTTHESTTPRRPDGPGRDTEPLRTDLEVWPTSDARMHAAAELRVASAAADLDSRGRDR